MAAYQRMTLVLMRQRSARHNYIDSIISPAIHLRRCYRPRLLDYPNPLHHSPRAAVRHHSIPILEQTRP